MSVGDHTGQMWLSGFNDVGQLIMGITADEFQEIKEEDESNAAAKLKEASLATYDFGCRAKAETYNETSRVKYQVMRASPINFVKAGLELAVSSVRLLFTATVTDGRCSRRTRSAVTDSERDEQLRTFV